MIMITLACAAGLFAQTGLFNLSYGMSLDQADSILAQAGFFPEASEDHAVKYYSDINEFVYAIMVFLEPNSQRIAGWFIKYNADNGEDNDHLVIDRISDMHGKTNHFEEETQQLIWFLTNTRTLHVMYAQDGSLTALYYDSYFADLFRMNDKDLSEE
jgi:hypothetical protein